MALKSGWKFQIELATPEAAQPVADSAVNGPIPMETYANPSIRRLPPDKRLALQHQSQVPLIDWAMFRRKMRYGWQLKPLELEAWSIDIFILQNRMVVALEDGHPESALREISLLREKAKAVGAQSLQNACSVAQNEHGSCKWNLSTLQLKRHAQKPAAALPQLDALRRSVEAIQGEVALLRRLAEWEVRHGLPHCNTFLRNKKSFKRKVKMASKTTANDLSSDKSFVEDVPNIIHSSPNESTSQTFFSGGNYPQAGALARQRDVPLPSAYLGPCRRITELTINKHARPSPITHA